MNTLYKFGLSLAIASVSLIPGAAQQQSTPPAKQVLSGSTISITIPAVNSESKASGGNTVVLSGTASSARIADPNAPVVFTGRVMRMADYVAAVSASSAEEQHLHIQEMRNRGTDQPAPQSRPQGSN